MVMDAMMPMLEGFHHMIERRILGMTARKVNVREWKWALVDAALEVTDIWQIREYARRRKSTIMVYAAGRSKYEICTGSDRMDGYNRFLMRWYQ